MEAIKSILEPYNQWWNNKNEWFNKVPYFKRPVFNKLKEDIDGLIQILSITGPRRVGKSTLLMQLIQWLLKEKNINPENIVYYSFDDPILFSNKMDSGKIIDSIMQTALQKEKMYLFFDEIQRFENWELYLKKYYDLKYPVRIIISGSASSPIFKKSRESLLGRVKDYKILPFSFREFSLFQLKEEPTLISEMQALNDFGNNIEGLLTANPFYENSGQLKHTISDTLKKTLSELLKKYFLIGGFPEVWEMPDWINRQGYLIQNQIEKVIFENLVLATEFRKPELLKRFYLSLLERPGQETNIQKMASITGINESQINKYLPLLEMTDILYSIQKFKSGSLKVRRGNMKYYLVDLALRNAVLRISTIDQITDDIMGLYAENLVFLILKRWIGAIQLDYFRDRNTEVDFLIHTQPGSYYPIEVKYQNVIKPNVFRNIKDVSHKLKSKYLPMIITKNWNDLGIVEGCYLLPLPVFLIMFD